MSTYFQIIFENTLIWDKCLVSIYDESVSSTLNWVLNDHIDLKIGRGHGSNDAETHSNFRAIKKNHTTIPHFRGFAISYVKKS